MSRAGGDGSSRPGLLRAAPQFRYFWLSRTVSATGVGAGRVALVLLASPAGPEAVSLVLLGSVLPQLLGPLAGAVADRVDQRRLLAGCEVGQGAVYGVIAVTGPPLVPLVLLVAVASLLAALMSPAGKGTVTRLVPPDRFARANAMLGVAVNMQVVAGPALGGVLAGLVGPRASFVVTAASFGVSALLLTRLSPLPPHPVAGRGGVLADAWLGLRFTAGSALLRPLALGTLVLVSFGAVDNVALVFLVKHSLHGSGTGYGATAAAFGAGMVAASFALTAWAGMRPPAHWLFGGIALGAVATVATGLAPTVTLAALAQAAAGAGNAADVVGLDTLLQQSVPPQLLGRAFGAIYSAAPLGSAIAYTGAGPLVSLAGPRETFVLAGVGMLAGLAVLTPALRGRQPAAAQDPS